MQGCSMGLSVIVTMTLDVKEQQVRLNAIWNAEETVHKCVAVPIETQFGPPIALQVGAQI